MPRIRIRELQSVTSNNACLLCGNEAPRVLQRIPSATLIEAYRAEIGIVPSVPVDALLYLTCDDCGLKFFSPPVTGDERFYAQLQKISWYYNAGKQEFRMAASRIGASHDVLEIGAGRGLFAREIRPASYTGLEFSPTAIEMAAASGVHLLAQSIEQHAEDHSARYDVVCAFQVLEHVEDPRSFLRAAARCLKPKGRLMASVPAEDGFARDAYWDVLNMPPHHVTRWTDAALRSVARICGLNAVELIHEPLGGNMRRAYARAEADRWLAQRLGFEPQLIDARLKSPGFRTASAVISAGVRRYLSISKRQRQGHAVLAVYGLE